MVFSETATSIITESEPESEDSSSDSETDETMMPHDTSDSEVESTSTERKHGKAQGKEISHFIYFHFVFSQFRRPKIVNK